MSETVEEAAVEEPRAIDPEHVYIIWNTRDYAVAGGPFDFEDEAESALERVAAYSSGRVTDVESRDAGEWYTVEEVTRKPIPEPEPAADDGGGAAAVDLDAMSKDELIAYAQGQGVSPANQAMNKAELIASIKANQ